MPHVPRVVGVYDIGTLLHVKTGKHESGASAWRSSMRHTSIHAPGAQSITTSPEYHVPVNAEVDQVDVSALSVTDKKFNSHRARVLDITGAGAAVANAIYHATGKRLLHSPITPGQLIA